MKKLILALALIAGRALGQDGYISVMGNSTNGAVRPAAVESRLSSLSNNAVVVSNLAVNAHDDAATAQSSTSATASLTGPSPKTCRIRAPSNFRFACIRQLAAAISPSKARTGSGNA